jgi:hypothetical protein
MILLMLMAAQQVQSRDIERQGAPLEFPPAMAAAMATYGNCVSESVNSKLAAAGGVRDKEIADTLVESAIHSCKAARQQALEQATELLKPDPSFADPTGRVEVINTALDQIDQVVRNATAPLTANDRKNDHAQN